jgi:hypothetical protein
MCKLFLLSHIRTYEVYTTRNVIVKKKSISIDFDDSGISNAPEYERVTYVMSSGYQCVFRFVSTYVCGPH